MYNFFYRLFSLGILYGFSLLLLYCAENLNTFFYNQISLYLKFRGFITFLSYAQIKSPGAWLLWMGPFQLVPNYFRWSWKDVSRGFTVHCPLKFLLGFLLCSSPAMSFAFWKPHRDRGLCRSTLKTPMLMSWGLSLYTLRSLSSGCQNWLAHCNSRKVSLFGVHLSFDSYIDLWPLLSYSECPLFASFNFLMTKG